jgi:hypothetical protein
LHSKFLWNRYVYADHYQPKRAAHIGRPLLYVASSARSAQASLPDSAADAVLLLIERPLLLLGDVTLVLFLHALFPPRQDALLQHVVAVPEMMAA